MSIKFPHTPICEVCNSEPADTLYALRLADSSIRWFNAGGCVNSENGVGYPIYYVGYERIFCSGTGVLQWLGQLGDKTWFVPADFGEALTRLAKEAGTYP